MPSAATDSTTQHTSNNKLSLLKLEPEILTHIIEYLLDASHVRYAGCPPNTINIRYAFQPAILRTCKSLSAIATKVFHRSHFIRVKTSSAILRDVIKSNSVQVWQKKINKFQHYHLHLTVNMKRLPSNDSQRKPIIFLICLDSIEGFTWSLRLTDLCASPGFTYTIRLGKNADGTKLSYRVQRLLLEPLHQVRGPYATCTVTGPVDEGLKEKTERLMSPRIFWTRARLWEFLDVMTYKQAQAHLAFANGSMLEAHALHHGLDQLCEALWSIKRQILQGDDYRLARIWLHLGTMITINFGLVELLYHWNKGDLEDLGSIQDGFRTILHQAGHEDVFHELDRKDQATLHFLCGAGQLFETGHDAAMKKSFAKALELFPENRQYQACVAIADTYPFAQQEPGTGKHWRDVKTVMAMLPKQPLSCTIPSGVSILPSIDFERHVLRALGYTGDVLEGRVEQKQGWSYHWTGERQRPFDLAMANTFIRFHQDHVDAYDPADHQGLPMAGWVKPPYVQLEGTEGRGEEIYSDHASGAAGHHHHHHHGTNASAQAVAANVPATDAGPSDSETGGIADVQEVSQLSLHDGQ